jgi:hypothetical protein
MINGTATRSSTRLGTTSNSLPRCRSHAVCWNPGPASLAMASSRTRSEQSGSVEACPRDLRRQRLLGRSAEPRERRSRKRSVPPRARPSDPSLTPRASRRYCLAAGAKRRDDAALFDGKRREAALTANPRNTAFAGQRAPERITVILLRLQPRLPIKNDSPSCRRPSKSAGWRPRGTARRRPGWSRHVTAECAASCSRSLKMTRWISQRSGPSGPNQDSALGQPERQLGMLRPLGRDVVVAAVCPDLIASRERKELPVPPLLLHVCKD